MPLGSRQAHVCAVAAYAAIAFLFSWPLPLHIFTHLTGIPSGDTGVYVWNLWVFRHEVLSSGHNPLYTSQIFAATGPADLSLHNYTVFADLVAFPLLPMLGVTATFNLIYLAMPALTGYATFLLARRVTNTWAEAWLAGLLFAFSPALVARGTAHFSLAAAAPLPVFVLLLMRTCESLRYRDAIAAGAAVAWAAFCDAYYAVYCVMLGTAYLVGRAVSVRRSVAEAPRPGAALRSLDVLIYCVAGLALGIAISGGGRFQVWGVRVTVQRLYTPMLVLTCLILLRAIATWRPTLWVDSSDMRPDRALRLAASGVGVCALLLSPVLYALGARLLEDRFPRPRTFWRSSPPGVDLLALFTPNPNHQLFGGPWRDWLTTLPGGFVENVAALGWVPLAVIGLAAWRLKYRPPAIWSGLALGFGLLSLGPFVRIAGETTYVPTPWALLRYAPIVGSARSPARFSVVTMLALAVTFGLALQSIGSRYPHARRRILTAIGCALLFELAPAPRPLYSASVPQIYQIVAADPRDVHVLELPSGIRDGVSSAGNFSALSQYYQTYHGKRLIGGYLSRVSPRRVERNRRIPVLRALWSLSEGRSLAEAERQALVGRGAEFVDRARLGYLVIDRSRASADLRQFAIEAFDLEKIAESNGRELYWTALGRGERPIGPRPR